RRHSRAYILTLLPYTTLFRSSSSIATPYSLGNDCSSLTAFSIISKSTSTLLLGISLRTNLYVLASNALNSLGCTLSHALFALNAFSTQSKFFASIYLILTSLLLINNTFSLEGKSFFVWILLYSKK